MGFLVTAAPFELDRCEALALQAGDGDDVALQSLVELLWPAWLEMARASPGLRALGEAEDHARQVALRLAQKLGKPGGHTLRLYVLWRERHPGKTFADWTRIVVANGVRTHVTHCLGPRVQGGEKSAKRTLNELSSSLLLDEIGMRPAITAAQTARQVLEAAREVLDVEQQRVLSLWLEGDTVEDIAAALALDAARARQIQRSAVERLRRHFKTSTLRPASAKKK